MNATDNKSILLFDGVCNLCNGAVQFVIKRDKNATIAFAALQSESGTALLKKFGLRTDDYDSFVFVENGKFYTKSTAALRVAKNLDGPIALLFMFIIVPRFIRDGVYSWVARNRYKWFGKQNECMIPTPALKARFLN